MSKAFQLSILAISVVLVVFVFLGGFMPGGVRASSNDNAYRQMEVYSEVLQHIQNDYVVVPDIAHVSNASLHGLLEGLDPESSYLTAEEAKQYQTLQQDGTAQVGMDVSKRYGYATVVAVEPGSAAEKANIKDGDVIESVGGKSTRVMPLALIRLELNGAPGTPVTFSVIRPASAAPDKLTLTRDDLPYPGVESLPYDNGSILYLRPYILSKDRVHQVIEQLHSMRKNNYQKVVLDLRDVAQGDVDSALRLTNAFMQTGTMGMLVGQTVPKLTFNAESKKFVTAAPLAVLVNRGTSGPAELVAGALLNSKRADVVGDRTFGAGVVHKQIPLPDGALLLLTVAKYETPDGTVIQEKGVTPNVVVAANGESHDEAAPEAAPETKKIPAKPAGGLAAPTIAKPVPAKSATPAAPAPDAQLNRALDQLRQKAA